MIAAITSHMGTQELWVNPALHYSSSRGWSVEGLPVVSISWDAELADVRRMAMAVRRAAEDPDRFEHTQIY